MGRKRKLLQKSDIKVNLGIPLSLYGEFEELHIIEKRKRGGKLLKMAFFVEVFKMVIRQWFNK